MTTRENSLDFVVANFTLLEEQLVTCMGYVPFIEQNRCAVSPRFSSILTEACSLIDTVLRRLAGEQEPHNLELYTSACEEHLELEKATTLLLVSPLRLLRPFEGWSTATPPWWIAYTQLRDDRVDNYSAARYLHTVTAVAGLHQVLARSWQFLGSLAKAGWFNESDEMFPEMLASRSIGAGPPEMAVESRLFVSAIRGSFVDWSGKKPSIEYWSFSERVKNYIWEYQGW